MIFLVRHAESEANVGIAASSSEKISITEKGRLNSFEFADKILTAPDLIVVSKHERTLQTAQPLINKYPESLLETWEIHEFTYLSPASCINTTKEDRKIRVEAYWDKCDPDYVDGPGSESFTKFFKRILGCYHKIEVLGDVDAFIFSHEQVISLVELLNRGDVKEPNVEAMHVFRHKLYSSPILNLQTLEIDSTEKVSGKLFVDLSETHLKDKQLLENEINDINLQDSINVEFCQAVKLTLKQAEGLGPLLLKDQSIKWRFSKKRNQESVEKKFRDWKVLAAVTERAENFLREKIATINHSWSSIGKSLFIRTQNDLSESQTTLFWYKAIIEDYDRLGKEMETDNLISNFFSFRDNGIHRFESSKIAINYLSKMQTKGLEKSDTKYFKMKLHLYGYDKHRIYKDQIFQAESLGVNVMKLYCEQFNDNVNIEDLLWVGKVVRTPYLKKPGLMKVTTDLILIIGRKDIHGRQLSPLTNYRKSVQNRRGFDRNEFRKKVLRMFFSQIHKNNFDSALGLFQSN